MNPIPLRDWIIFGLVITSALAIDLLAFRYKRKPVTVKGALVESACWIALSLGFGAWLYFSLDHRAGLDFFAAYLLEKSLSLDNIFIFLMIFQAFGVPLESQHRTLFSGVIGALILRAAFVVAGIELLESFNWVTYIFGAFLLLIGLRMLFVRERTAHPEQSWVVRVTRKILPVTGHFEGDRFWLRVDGRLNATPLLLALVAVEATDIVFALDSVPAVLSVTRNTFIAYSSNAFAILGLRALYFALADVFPRFRFLHQGLAMILIFAGFKMIAGAKIPMSTALSLILIAGILVLAIVASLALPQRSPGSGAHRT